MKQKLLNFWEENKGFLLLVLLMFMFRSTFADWNSVPTGSMKPTILEGDRILVNKMAYDIRVPFTHISLLKMGDPERGDIIVFDSESSDKRLVKRVVGVPGDVISLRDNVLSVNGVELDYTYLSDSDGSTDKTEDLLGVKHRVRLADGGSMFSNFPPVRVPEGGYLAMGDNRDRSADSRVIGFVPRGEIVGRSRTVVLSFNYENYYIPRSGRYLQAL